MARYSRQCTISMFHRLEKMSVHTSGAELGDYDIPGMFRFCRPKIEKRSHGDFQFCNFCCNFFFLALLCQVIWLGRDNNFNLLGVQSSRQYDMCADFRATTIHFSLFYGYLFVPVWLRQISAPLRATLNANTWFASWQIRPGTHHFPRQKPNIYIIYIKYNVFHLLYNTRMQHKSFPYASSDIHLNLFVSCLRLCAQHVKKR